MRFKGLVGLILSLVVTACGGEYDVRISFVDADTKLAASRVQVAIVRDCSQQNLGEAPTGTVRSVEFRTDGTSPALGEVDPGSYGLYARASDTDCNVIAAGCTPISVEADTEATLAVQLQNVSAALCSAGIACSATGQCVGGDTGNDVDAAVHDASTDGSRDAGNDVSDVFDAGPDVFDASPDVFDASPDVFDGGNTAPDLCEDTRLPLVAWYRMDSVRDGINDSSDQGVPTRSDGPLPSLVAGVVNRAYEMTVDTAPIHVEPTVAQEALFDARTSGFSVTAFARLGNTDQDMTIVSKPGYWIGVNDTGTHLEVWTTSTTLSLAVPLDFRPGEWGHITVTWDPGDRVIRSYQNGVFSAASASVSINFDDDGDVTIGALPPLYNERWDGTLDEVRIYNRALSPAQIAELAVCN